MPASKRPALIEGFLLAALTAAGVFMAVQIAGRHHTPAPVVVASHLR